MNNQITFNHQEFLMPDIALRLCRGAGGHAVQVKAGAKRPVGIQLQHFAILRTV